MQTEEAMNSSTSSLARAIPVISVDVTPMIEEFICSISLDQTMDLALGKPDDETKSNFAELLFNLVEECTAFILNNIRVGRIKIRDVDGVVSDTLLKSFADALLIEKKVQPQSFDGFKMSFVKHVKEKVRHSMCSLQDQAASSVLQLCETNPVDSMLPNGLRMMSEFLVLSCKDQRQRARNDAGGEQNVFQTQQTGDRPAISSAVSDSQTVEQSTTQNLRKKPRKLKFWRSFYAFRLGKNVLPVIHEEQELEEVTAETPEEENLDPENQESDFRAVDNFIPEMTMEMESDLKMVDDFISEEISEVTKESSLTMENEFIPEELSDDRHFDASSYADYLGVNLLPVIQEEPELEEVTEVEPDDNNLVPELQESDVKMVEDFISEMTKEKKSDLKMTDELISAELSEVRERKETISEQQRDRAAPLPIKKKRIGVGVRIRRFLRKYTGGRYKRVAPEQVLHHQEELGGEEGKVSSVENIIPEESDLSTGITLVVEEQKSQIEGLETSVTEEQRVISVCKQKILQPAKKPSALHRYLNLARKFFFKAH